MLRLDEAIIAAVEAGMVTGDDEEAASASVRLKESKELISSFSTAVRRRPSRENAAALSAGDKGGDEDGDLDKPKRVLVGEWEQNKQHRLFLLHNTDAGDDNGDPPQPETRFSGDGGRTLS